MFHATPIGVPITDLSSEHLSAGFLQPGPGMGVTPGYYEPTLGHFAGSEINFLIWAPTGKQV